jgi:tRNA-dihydrouridine synthase
MRKHFGWYIKGFPGAAPLRQSLVTAKDHSDMFALLSGTEERLRNNNAELLRAS